MESTKYLSLNLQEDVPEQLLRTEDDFSSDSGGESEHESEDSEESKKMEIDNGEEFEEETKISGWADAMAKVLKTNAPKGKKTVVLAKAKKISEVMKTQKSPDIGFEIDGEVKEEKHDIDLIKEETEEHKEKKRVAKNRNREWALLSRIKPDVLEKNRERTLAKISTKGVVQLFNAVRDHQKKLNKKLNEAGTEVKREKVLKSVNKQSFLDMLMGPTGTKTHMEDSVKSEPEMKDEDKTSWNVLRDDFMMGASLKDWDKKLESPSVPMEMKEQEQVKSDDDIDTSDDDSDGIMENESFHGGESSDDS